MYFSVLLDYVTDELRKNKHWQDKHEELLERCNSVDALLRVMEEEFDMFPEDARDLLLELAVHN